MRKIKFRAWDKKNNIMEEDVHKSDIFYDMTALPDYYHVMQFTGLLDRNGKEIYEGDILKVMDRAISAIPSEVDPNSYMLSIVEYYGGQFDARVVGTGGSWHWHAWHKAEIIGIIYENNELTALN